MRARCICDHQCEFHPYTLWAIGKGDANLLTVRDGAKMRETQYRMSGYDAAKWSDILRDVDMEKFEQHLVEGKTLEQALRAVT